MTSVFSTGKTLFFVNCSFSHLPLSFFSLAHCGTMVMWKNVPQHIRPPELPPPKVVSHPGRVRHRNTGGLSLMHDCNVNLLLIRRYITTSLILQEHQTPVMRKVKQKVRSSAPTTLKAMSRLQSMALMEVKPQFSYWKRLIKPV